MEMDGGQSVEMELTSISCKGVKASFNLFQKPALYAVISVSGDADRAQKTPVDRVGGENPEWDHPIRLDVGYRSGGGVLDFEVKAQGMLTDSTVGQARIPLADLDFCGDLRHASYQVRSPDGKSNGAISFSYKVNGLDLPDECCVAALELDLPSPRPPLSFKVNDDPGAIKYPTVDPHPPPPVFDYNHHQQPPAAAFGYGHPQPPPAFDYGHQAAAPPFDYGRRELAPDPAGSSPPPGYGYGWPAQPTAAGGGEFYPPQAPAYAAYPPPPQAPAYAAYPPPPQAPAYGAYPPPPAYGAYHPQPPPTCCYHEPHGLNPYRPNF